MQLFTLLSYPVAKLMTLSFDQFSIIFSSAISHLDHLKDKLSIEKDHGIILHYRDKINKVEGVLITLRMHKHYQAYQNEIAAVNIKVNKAA